MTCKMKKNGLNKWRRVYLSSGTAKAEASKGMLKFEVASHAVTIHHKGARVEAGDMARSMAEKDRLRPYHGEP